MVDEYYLLVFYQALIYIALAQAWNLLAGYGGLVSLAPAASVGLGMYTAGRARQSLQLLGPAADHRRRHRRRRVRAARQRPDVPLPRALLRDRDPGAGARRWACSWSTGTASAAPSASSSPTYAPSAQTTLLLLARRWPWSPIVDRLRRPAHATRPEPARHPRRRGHRPGDRRLDLPHQALGVGRVVLPHRHGRRPAGRAPRARSSRTGRSRSTWTINIVSTTIVGGIGTIVGPIIGAGFTVWLGEALSGYPELHVAITGVIVILIIRFAPTGIWGIAVGGYKRLAAAATRGRRRAPSRHAPRSTRTRPASPRDGPTPGAVRRGRARSMLKTDAITKRYGDVVAVSEVEHRGPPRRGARHHRPQRRRQEHASSAC